MFDSPKYQNKETKKYVKDVLNTFETFGIPMELVEVVEGMHELHIFMCTKKPTRMAEIEKFQKDLAYVLGNSDVTIQAPVQGRKLIGVSIPTPNAMGDVRETVIKSDEYKAFKGYVVVPLGVTELNEPVVADITTWPHALIAGSTGSGKSNCLHNIILSLIERYGPDELRLMLFDTKGVEFMPYDGIPHLLAPPIGDVRKGLFALKWLTKEMDRRYDALRQLGVQDAAEYHRERKATDEPMPYIVVVIDELAYCMERCPQEYEAAIVRLLQMSRPVGVHLLIATQHPSGKTVTGPVRANIPTTLAFRTSTMVDSRTILNQAGAEKLLGYGDALYLRADEPRPLRIQTPVVVREAMKSVIAEQCALNVTSLVGDFFDNSETRMFNDVTVEAYEDELDELYEAVREFVTQEQKASTSLIQRRFKVGYGRSARIIDQLAEQGVIQPSTSATGSPWKVSQKPQGREEWEGEMREKLEAVLSTHKIPATFVELTEMGKVSCFTFECETTAQQKKVLTLRTATQDGTGAKRVTIDPVPGKPKQFSVSVPLSK